jgi:aminoglycoside phosphotransferase (APT) family kinase protein
MHAEEVDIDADLVRRLVASQFSRLSDLPISPVPSTGTVNAIYRLGDHLYARLPRLASWAPNLDKECRWLPMLAPHLSLRVPEPVLAGRPGDSYPFSWAIYRWIDGQLYADETVDDEHQAAIDLAQFVAELRRVDPSGAPRGGRRPLGDLDSITRSRIESARDIIDSTAAIAAWEYALSAPAWDGTPVWIHADLLRSNLLVEEGRLCAVIDFGGAGVGDPAADVVAAWTVFGRAGREAFRSALDVDNGTWNRARGFALHQAAMAIPYYIETNPEFVSLAKRTLEEVLVDTDG